MKKRLFNLLLVLLSFGVAAQAAHTFEIKDGNFYRDGKVTRILSGEMHYSRIPHEYWRHRLRMMKGMGLNTVATYVFWNYHETAPGVWDFTGDRNLAEYIRIAGEENMMVILRPGPYVCAEWEFGGYPWWLQNVEGMEVRRDNEQFLKHTKEYINRLYQEVGELQCTKGGPIIMVQCENEFGSYVSQRKDIPMEEHRAYNAKIKQQLLDAGFTVPMFTSDGSWLFDGGSTPGALPTANGEGDVEHLKKAVNEYHNGVGPYMVAEFYPGWLSHWAEPFPAIDASQIARQTETYLKNDVSFNYYMVHGGTNFAFTAGANYDKKRDIQPDLTSYDYDAPISEAGWATAKYDSIRNVIQAYTKGKLPKVPERIPVITIPSIKLNKVADILAYAETLPATTNASPLAFEDLNQGYGYVLYTRHFNQPISGTLEIPGLRDYAVVYVDGEKMGELNRNTRTYSLDIEVPFNATLQILVENMGRINYGGEIVHNRKGIISPVTIDEKEITGSWKMYGLPMTDMPDLSGKASYIFTNSTSKGATLKNCPVMYSGTFTLDATGDTFLDMSKWGKGIVFVNGHNLGRYWQVGPQQTLYLPGVWLNKGENTIVIFEQLNEEPQKEISSVAEPVLTQQQ
jgi:beta-galactosidase